MQYARRTDDDLELSHIEPTWIRSGEPTAKILQWGSSADGLLDTYVWSCTAGTFDWTFARDEIVHIVEGSVTVTSPEGVTRTLEVGDSALFPAGTTWLWQVGEYVRKHAILSTPVPALVRPGVKAALHGRRAVARVRAGDPRVAGVGVLAAGATLALGLARSRVLR